MKRNLWGFDSIEELLGTDRTDSIFEIIREQCEILETNTDMRVFAKFGLLQVDHPMKNALFQFAAVADLVTPRFQEEIDGDVQTGHLENASNLYDRHIYGFEIYNDVYRFKIFEVEISPIYPVMLLLDAGIKEDILNELCESGYYKEKNEKIQISSENEFESILSIILKSKKLHYIIAEMLKNKKKDSKIKKKYSRCIICEGKSDEIILRTICLRLKKDIKIITAGGKRYIPVTANGLAEAVAGTHRLIVIDADGNREETEMYLQKHLEKKEQYTIVMPETSMEEWFGIDVKKITRLEFLQRVETIVQETDFHALSKKYFEFQKLIDFIQDA